MRKRTLRVTVVLALLCAVFLVNVSAASDHPYRIEVISNQNIVIVYKQDSKGAYTQIEKVFICTTGNATPIGTFSLSDKYIWKTLMGPCYGQYACRFSGDCLFHSVPYYKQSKDTLMYKEYNKLGRTASHGCIRLTAADAKWIYDNCPTGTTVKVYETKKFVVQQPSHITIKSSNPNRGWDPTDPDLKNPWLPPKKTTQTTPPAKTIPEKKVPTVTKGSQVIKVDGQTVNLDIYYLTDQTGNTASFCSLRELANVLDGSEAQFNVGWDSGKRAVMLTSGVPYTDRNGKEGSSPFSGPQPYQLSSNTMIVNGGTLKMQAIILTAKNGDAYTFVKLRDLCTALGFQVNWSQAEGISIETGRSSVVTQSDDPESLSQNGNAGDTGEMGGNINDGNSDASSPASTDKTQN